MSFEFTAPGRVVFGEGKAREAAAIVARLGRRALVVESGSGRAAFLHEQLRAGGLTTITVRVSGEPTVALIEDAAARGRDAGCDVVVGLGGGSVIDAGKAIAALLTNREPVREYLEVVGRGRPLTERAAPYVAIPTTAGTGAEVTRNAVLMVEEERVKVSLRSPLMLPAVAIVDPELTWTVPPDVTASTGLDALAQCIEPFVSSQANPLTDAIAREGMRRAARALRRAYRDGGDVEARRDMAIASLCGGLALANAKLGAVHGFAAPLGGMFPVPHGVACARLLAPVTAVNVRALRARQPASPAVERYDEVARILTGSPDARAGDAVAWLAALADDLAIPPLATFGMTATDIAPVVFKARVASSMQGNPIVLTDAELHEALASAVGR